MTANSSKSIRDRLAPMPRDSGFRMAGYYIWCGSAIRVGDTYHLFASRWPNGKSYFTHSEIVRATAKQPEGPYQFQEVVLGKRAKGRWDSQMAHNPAIYALPGAEGFALFYLGLDDGGSWGDRRIGVATAKSIEGPWNRPDKPLDLGFDYAAHKGLDANNPAALIDANGFTRLIWRDTNLQVRISVAPNPFGPYAIANDNLWPGAKLEDFFLYRRGGKYHLICEDNVGGLSGCVGLGVHLVSDDGIGNWRKADPLVVYDHTIRWTDGTQTQLARRERPWLLIENGVATHVFNSCSTTYLIAENIPRAQLSWNQAVRIEGGYQVEG